MQQCKRLNWKMMFVLILTALTTTLFNGGDVWAQNSPADYPPNPTQDIPWSVGKSGVADVAAAFNNARQVESAQLGINLPTLSMPSQAEWDRLNDGEKALWLINEERTARNVMPLHGLEENVTSVAQYYAEYLLANGVFGHQEDGNTPSGRLQANATIGTCWEFLGENLFYSAATYPIPVPVEQAVYGWLYEDGDCCDWGHRAIALYFPYNDNGGESGKEGFLGIGRASGPFDINGTTWPYAEMVVMNVFDPCADWVYPTVNRNPVAVDDTASTDQGQAVTINVLSNDSDPDGDTLTITATGTPGNGSASIQGNQIRYTPNAGFTGVDSFTYTISDGKGGTASATVNVTVAVRPEPKPGVATSTALSKWPQGRLIDGDGATTWSSHGHAEHLESTEWAALILDREQTISKIRLLPRVNPNAANETLGFPKDFVLLYSSNVDDEGERTCDPNDPNFDNITNWRPLVSKAGYPQPKSGWLEFTFDPEQAQCVRILATQLTQDDFGYRYLQLSEFEVMGP